MDYNFFSNGDQDQSNQYNRHFATPKRWPTPMFDWMSSQPRVYPESLPRAPESVVYEGFIPDAYPGLYQPAATFPNNTSEILETNLDRPTNGNNGDKVEEEGEEEPSTVPPGVAVRSRNATSSGSPNLTDADVAATENAVARVPKKPKRGRPFGSTDSKPRIRKPKKGEGKRGGWCKGMKLGRRPRVEASSEFNRLYSEAVDCIIAEPPDPQKALELITQAIALNPEQHQAHPVLAEAHHMLGNDQAAIDVLFVGAHANPRDPEAWQDVARRCQEWKGIGREAALEKAIIAYSELINIDKTDYESRFKRAANFREQGKPTKCINELDKVLNVFPHNSSALEEYAYACIDLQRIPRAIDLFKDAIEHHMELGLGGSDDPFDWSSVRVYVDLVARNGKPMDTIPKAIRALKTLSRWLLGRQSETYWEKESLRDDAEFDPADEPRRIRVVEYMPAVRRPETYGYGLPLELRAQLGILRLRNGDRLEALGHFKLLMEPVKEDGESYVKQFSDIFLQVAKALADTKEHGEALRFYEGVWKAGEIDSHDSWIGIGHSSYVCNKREQALECFENAQACDSNSLEAKTWIGKVLIEKGDQSDAIEFLKEAVETGHSRINHKADTRVYERKQSRLMREEAERALKHAHQLLNPVVKQRRSNKRKQPDDEEEQDDTGLFDATPPVEIQTYPLKGNALRRYNRTQRGPRPLKIQLLPDEDEHLRQERVLQYYTTLLNNTEAMRSGDSIARGIWIDCAKSLIDDFRSTKAFFPKSLGQGLTPEIIDAINNLESEPRQELHRSTTQSQTPGSPTPDPSTQNPIPQTLPTTYRTIPFTNWLDIFLEYSLLLSHPPPQSPPTTPPNPSHKRPCYDTIALALNCIIFTINPHSIFQIQLCHLICALAFRDQKTLFDNVLRWFMREHAFSSTSYQLFGAMNYYFPYFSPAIVGQTGGGNGSTHHSIAGGGGKEGVMQRSVWRNTNTSKALRRHIYGIDKALVDDYTDPDGTPVPAFMREERHETFIATETQTYTDPFTGITTTKKVPVRTTEMDVVLLTLYGQILYATGSYTSALSYFFRARAVEPKNPLVPLSIALSYMHQALKKGEESGGGRHLLVLQGWAMFQDYAEARLAWAMNTEDRDGERDNVSVVEEIKREITFNKARCWDMLGLAGLAGKVYEKLLVRDGDVVDPMILQRDEGRDEDAAAAAAAGQDMEKENGVDSKWTMEAAYAMRNMYLVGGDMESARMVVQKWLVVE